MLNYVTGYTGFSGDEAKQSGNYLALKFAIPEGATATVELVGGTSGPVSFGSDDYCVFRILNNKTQSIQVVVTGTDGSTLTKDYSLAGLTLKSA